MKNTLTLSSLDNKFFNSLRDDNDEPPNFTYNDKYMRYIVRQSIKNDRCVALNDYYKSTISDEVLNIISKELDVNGNIF